MSARIISTFFQSGIMETQIIESVVSTDRVDVKTVMEHFAIGKTIFYGKYLADCKIKPTKVGNFSYISQDDFDLLKSYHLARGTGKEALAEFIKKLEGKLTDSEAIAVGNLDPQAQYIQTINGLMNIVQSLLTDKVNPAVSYEQLTNKLSARLSVLEHYSQYPNARLTGRELATILEISHKTLYGKKEYSRIGYRFVSDSQGWRVIQIEKVIPQEAIAQYEKEVVDDYSLVG
jgi:hypothetical protein